MPTFDLAVRGIALIPIELRLAQGDKAPERPAYWPRPPFRPIAMIDTGTTRTFIDRELLEFLGAPLLCEVPAGHIRGRSVATRMFRVGISVLGVSFDPLEVYEDEFPSEGAGQPPLFQLVIGTEILSRFRFVYDGPEKKFSLDLPGHEQPPR